jgi:hypothetical protein
MRGRVGAGHGRAGLRSGAVASWWPRIWGWRLGFGGARKQGGGACATALEWCWAPGTQEGRAMGARSTPARAQEGGCHTSWWRATSSGSRPRLVALQVDTAAALVVERGRRRVGQRRAGRLLLEEPCREGGGGRTQCTSHRGGGRGAAALAGPGAPRRGRRARAAPGRRSRAMAAPEPAWRRGGAGGRGQGATRDGGRLEVEGEQGVELGRLL